MEKYRLTHARHDPVICLCPGLFRSLGPGDRKKLKLDITYKYGKGKEFIRFVGFQPLGVDDMRVLQALVALAGPDGIELTEKPETKAGQELRDQMFDVIDPDMPLGSQQLKNAIAVRGSYRRLAVEIGYQDIDGGAAFAHIRDCIERLWSVSIVVGDAYGKREGYRMLSRYASDEKTGGFVIGLNPRLADAILGKRHTRIDLREARVLKTDVARLIHQRLSGWVNQGKSGMIDIDSVCQYIWPEATKNKNTLKTRRQTAKKAIAELSLAGWDAMEYEPGKYIIKRPGIKPPAPRN